MNIIPTKSVKGDRPRSPARYINQQRIQSLTRLGKNLSIAKKIGYGYALAIGIAVFGGQSVW